MTDSTIIKIKAYSTDENKGNSLEALMNYCGKSNLQSISEEQGQEFLAKLENGEITV